MHAGSAFLFSIIPYDRLINVTASVTIFSPFNVAIPVSYTQVRTSRTRLRFFLRTRQWMGNQRFRPLFMTRLITLS